MCVCVCVRERERDRDRQTDRQTERQRHTERFDGLNITVRRERERGRERQTDRQRERDRDRDTERFDGLNITVRREREREGDRHRAHNDLTKPQREPRKKQSDTRPRTPPFLDSSSTDLALHLFRSTIHTARATTRNVCLPRPPNCTQAHSQKSAVAGQPSKRLHPLGLCPSETESPVPNRPEPRPK